MNTFLLICAAIVAASGAVKGGEYLWGKYRKSIGRPLRTVYAIAEDFEEPTLKEVIVSLDRRVETLNVYMHEARHSIGEGVTRIEAALSKMTRADNVRDENLAVAKIAVEGVAEDLAASQERADKVNGDSGSGAAADAASKSAVETYHGEERRSSVNEWFAKERRETE